MVGTTVNLKHGEEWRAGMTQDCLATEIDQRLRIAGTVNRWTMPIKSRIDMPSTGIRITLGVMSLGRDLEVIQRIIHDTAGALSSLRGTASIFAGPSFGGRYLGIRLCPEAPVRYGPTTADVHEVLVMALGGDIDRAGET